MKQTTNKKVYKSDFPKTLLIVAIHGHSIYILYIYGSPSLANFANSHGQERVCPKLQRPCGDGWWKL